MELVKAGRRHMLPPVYAQAGAVVADVRAVRASRADLKLRNCEEALQIDPVVGKWIQLAQIAAICSHQHVLEDEGRGVFFGGAAPMAARRLIKQGSQGARSHQTTRIKR
jgi:hypothetical protein